MNALSTSFHSCHAFGSRPMFSVIVAGMAADMAGCTLHEGFTNPCVIAGKDRGELLYGMFVMGWLFLVTMPFAAIFAIALLIMGVRWWRRGELQQQTMVLLAKLCYLLL